MTTLDPQVRGTTFERTFTLTVDWTGALFTGGVKFTLRKRPPESSVISDADSDVVDQASVATGEITFTGAGTAQDPCKGTVKISATRTKAWPARQALFFDLKGTVTATGEVYPLASGQLPIVADMTRSMP